MKEKYSIGEVVFLITDKEQEERMITAIMKEQNSIQYRLSFGTTTSWHFEIEINTIKDYSKI